MTERALAVEQQTGYVSRPHRDAVPNDLIPFVSSYDQSVSISDYDLWHLAKFAPWHPTLRHRMPAGRHYLLKNVPPGTSPQAIKQFLGDLYDSRAGDTYRFPSTYSWDPRHGIIIEPLVQIFSADGQSVSYEYSAWYLHSLNNKRKLYHNVSYSHLPAATRVLDSLSTSPQDVDSVPVQPFSGIGGSQLVLPLASQAMCEKATFAPNLSDLNGLDSVQRFFPGEVYRPEQVDRFTHGLRDGISTQNFEAQFGGEERFISLEEHESVYRKPEGFAKGCDESMSMALSSEQLAQNRKNHVAHMTRSRKTPKRSNSIEISDLTSQSKSPLAELSDVTDSMSEDSSSEDEEPNVLADTPIILAIASGDSEEHIVVKILDRFNTPDGEHCTVLWFGGDTSSVPTKDIKNTKAYSEFVKLENVDLFCNSRNVAKSKPTKLKRTSSSMSIPKSSSVVKTPVAKRTRSSRREKR
ncbi:hypothetical protein GEMRC1_000605 [Eukaryota sp. GEM-RC1]